MRWEIQEIISKVEITENRYQYEMVLKNELREKGWTQRDLPPEDHQPSFLRGDESDAQLGFKFEWTYLADIKHLFLFYPSSNSTKIYIICPVYQNISVPIYVIWLIYFFQLSDKEYTSWSP